MKKAELVFLGAKRTVFGANGGALRDENPTDLGVLAGAEALKQSGVSPEQIDHVIFGSVLHASADAIYTPRHIGLKLGIPREVGALGVNRLCGTGFQVIIEALGQFHLGDSQTALVGGVENMSMAPYVMRKARFGQKLGNQQLSDSLMEGLHDTYAGIPMAITAENLAERFTIPRAACDEFSLASQTKFQAAEVAGFFASERISHAKLARDEHARPEATLEGLAKLKPIFKKDGVVTAGNASGIVDGAAALVVSTPEWASSNKREVLGRLLGHAVVGCDPEVMGIGPVPAIRKLLTKLGSKIDDFAFVEINEAFASQTLSCAKELGLSLDRLNPNGGAIAVGHPLAASGARITMSALYELKRRGGGRAIVSACIGGGQGIALAIEV